MQYNLVNGQSSDANTKELLARSFKGNNNLGARESFVARTKYDLNGYSITGPRPLTGIEISNDVIENAIITEIDGVYKIFNDSKVPLYGTVDKNIIPLQPKKQYLSYYLENNGGYSALDFVMNSFINMRKAYTRGMFEGKGVKTGFILSNLEINKARIDENILLGELYNSIVTNFIRYVGVDYKNRKKIVSPENFINYFSNYLVLYAINDIVTYSSMLLTDKADINFNGLCLDIASLPYESDREKVRDFILDPNFSFFLDTAKSFGFVISKEYPFKLIANLNSQKMRNDICACGSRYLNGLELKTAEDVVNFYFEPSYLYDLQTLKSLISYAYDAFFNAFRFERVSSYYDGSIHSKRILRTSSQSFYIDQLVTERKLLLLYIRLKNSEMRLRYSDYSLNLFYNRALYIYDNYGLNDSMKYINEKIRIALEPFIIDKKGFRNTESFSVEEALALIRLTRYDY